MPGSLENDLTRYIRGVIKVCNFSEMKGMKGMATRSHQGNILAARRVLALFALLALPTLLITACNRRSSNVVSIRLKWLHQAQFAGFYFAKEAGYYSERGVQVTLRPGGVDYPAVQMVASGSDQFGVTGADQVLIARDKGIPLIAVACIYQKTPFVLFSLKSSGITSIKDFPGKRIGVKLGGNEELTYRAMLEKAGVSSKSFTEVPVKFDISPLLDGKVDVWPGYSINEPITAEEKGYAVNVISPSDYNIHFYADVLFTTESMIRTEPEVVNAVTQATVRGWQEALLHKNQAVTYTLRYGTELTREHEMKMLLASSPLIAPQGRSIGSMEISVWKEMAETMRAEHFLAHDVDVAQAFTTEFLPRK